MRHKRSWVEMNCPKRPLVFEGWGDLDKRPSTFKWEPMDIQTPAGLDTARLYYRVGWTGLAFWDSEVFFADEIFTFDEMLDLVRSRFGAAVLRHPIAREYVDV